MKSDKAKKERPLSPHLSIYKPQISSVLSALHRMSGVVLFCALSFFLWWFILLIFTSSIAIADFSSHIIFRSLLFIMSGCFFYHICSGLRHLFWDIGKFFTIKQMHITGWIALGAAAGMFSLFWLYMVGVI